jgi:hypothetical protein
MKTRLQAVKDRLVEKCEQPTHWSIYAIARCNSTVTD